MHISNISGHRSASLAIEKSLREIDGRVQIKCIDGINYTSPVLEKLISKTYMSVIKRVPRLWDYLYDNKDVLRKVKRIRALIHRLKDKKIRRLFNSFKPDIVVCTQAFPCGMVADYKRRHNLKIPLVAVLTDYAAHGYWLSDFVDLYVVPTPEIKQRLIQRGITAQRLKVLGIPVDIKFSKQGNREQAYRKLGLDSSLPIILIMGGGQGLGPIREIVGTLDKLTTPSQLIVVCGTNKNLYRWLKKHESFFNKPVIIMGYTECVNDLMDISSLIVSKPGGLTSAEALTKSLPIIIVSPLPGQESLNARFLLETGVALKVENLLELRSLVEELLNDKTKLEMLRQRAGASGRVDSAQNIARFILNMA